MDTLFKHITLSWRLGSSHSRYLVGQIYEKEDKVYFKYLKNGVESAKKEGFNGYPGLPINWDNFNHEYENVFSLFSKRLINFERTDTQPLLDFWEIDPTKKEDKLYLLAMTQGKNPTDNFEFLASFNPIKGLCFVTDIAGLSHSRFDLTRLNIGNKLAFKEEDIPGIDPHAIAIFFKKEKIGYIKKGHRDVFTCDGCTNINLEVKAIINKQLFIKVFCK